MNFVNGAWKCEDMAVLQIIKFRQNTVSGTDITDIK